MFGIDSWQGVAIVLGVLALVAVAIWSVMGVGRTAAGAALSGEDARRLRDIRDHLERLTEGQHEQGKSLDEIRERLASIERLLREVG
jgi:hypothetical protein